MSKNNPIKKNNMNFGVVKKASNKSRFNTGMLKPKNIVILH